jgi:hypothetical protein
MTERENEPFEISWLDNSCQYRVKCIVRRRGLGIPSPIGNNGKSQLRWQNSPEGGQG